MDRQKNNFRAKLEIDDLLTLLEVVGCGRLLFDFLFPRSKERS